MALEIERKFLVKSEDWKIGAIGVAFRQGYLSRSPQQTVRIRIAGEKAFLTIKGLRSKISRLEFEYEIPLADAAEMLNLCVGPLIEKTRFEILHGGKTWEVDEFHGDNAGLIVAEIELNAEDESFLLPDWIGEEVSDDVRYFNSNLAVSPFSTWKRP